MAEQASGGQAPPPDGAANSDKQSRDQSTIQFPYGDLDDAVSVARALVEAGGVPCDVDQLAAAMKQTPMSGNFRMKIATARMFGVLETVGGKYQLTNPLGFAIVDSSREKIAKADAFLNVPLYKKVYDTFRGQQLPPRPMALERTFIQFGVAPKSADRARQAFDRSAQVAGYFGAGRDRLVRPTVGGATTAAVNVEQPVRDPPTPPAPIEHHQLGNGGGGGHHPFIEGLLKTLPASGTVWAIEGRAAWLEAAASVFKLLYQGDGRITVTSAAEGSQQKSGASH